MEGRRYAQPAKDRLECIRYMGMALMTAFSIDTLIRAALFADDQTPGLKYW
jgi:hypothetical protein